MTTDKILFSKGSYQQISPEIDKEKFNLWNSDTWFFPVKTGDLVMFPGWINHKSLPNESDEDRIIIGTNYFITGKFGHQKTKDYIEIG